MLDVNTCFSDWDTYVEVIGTSAIIGGPQFKPFTTIDKQH